MIILSTNATNGVFRGNGDYYLVWVSVINCVLDYGHINRLHLKAATFSTESMQALIRG